MSQAVIMLPVLQVIHAGQDIAALKQLIYDDIVSADGNALV